MNDFYVHKTERIGDLIVQVVNDPFGESSNPRDNDNYTRIYGDHNHYTIGDGKPPSEHQYILERGGVRLLYRYMRLFGDPANKFSKVLAFAKVSMLDHSGVTFWAVPIGQKGTHWSDSAGWDSGGVGYVYVARDRWALMMGDDDTSWSDMVDDDESLPLGKVAIKRECVLAYLHSEVEEYDDWAKGNVWGYTVTKPCDHPDTHGNDESIASCPHSETIGSCFGFIGDPELVWPEAEAEAKAANEH